MNEYYIIVVRGCDDINKSLIAFNNLDDFNNFIFYSKRLNKKSNHDCCKPTIHLFKNNFDTYHKIDLYNLSDFDDLIGGYYE